MAPSKKSPPTDPTALFPESYQASRDRFRHGLARIQSRWPGARLERHSLETAGEEDLTIDWIEAPSKGEPERLLAITAGIHGIEAFVGSAVLHVCTTEILPRLDPDTTGLLLVHTINPWGMKHRRRTNAHNVDLNRNFVHQPGDLDPAFNPEYRQLDVLLNPRGTIESLPAARLRFWLHLLQALVRVGPDTIAQASLLGQYHSPQGVYFGGQAIQEETRMLTGLFRLHLPAYGQTVLIDLHTGYGPCTQMSLVHSCQEPRGLQEIEERYAYPLAVKADPETFYAMRGDMIDFLYWLQNETWPDRRLYAISFEFGTLGDSLIARLRSLQVTILENQAHWFGTGDTRAKEEIHRDYTALFYPQEVRWRQKALTDARQALEGILRHEGYLD